MSASVISPYKLAHSFFILRMLGGVWETNTIDEEIYPAERDDRFWFYIFRNVEIKAFPQLVLYIVLHWFALYKPLVKGIILARLSFLQPYGAVTRTVTDLGH